MTPDEVRTSISIGGFLGAIFAAFGISRYQSKKNDERITAIENKGYLTRDEFLSACSQLRESCSACTAVFDLKDGVKTLSEEIKTEFRSHNDLHRDMAGKIGSLSQAVKDMQNSMVKK